MASNFRPVNSPMSAKIEQRDGGAQPATPTPTNAAFGQRPLPTEAFPQAVQIPESIKEEKAPQCNNFQRSPTTRRDSEDVDMDDEDGEAHGNEEGAGSDEESVNADGSKSTKKKKSQRFWCTEYPPCNLSFTRSEHLARHIRKHTGERPFQCHCSRRFSRLDNLRQHAQTVHINEDIPDGSLAAAGTRFQRQLRTDRVRQPGRARAATAGSIVGPPRGHSKSLSTSNIGSDFSTRDDIRRRPPSLIMAGDYRPAYSSEMYPHQPPSPSDFDTPTSATFSTGQASPRWAPTIASPTSSHPRPRSLYAGPQVPARRLSVPSSGIPFQSQQGMNPSRPVFEHGSPGFTVTPHPPAYSPASSVLASPVPTVFSRRESTAGADDLRRRTWHPDSTNFNTNHPGSRMSQVFAPSHYPTPPQRHVQPPVQQQQSGNLPQRLPGIDSFGPLPHRPASPLRNNIPSIMVKPELVPHHALLPNANAAEPDGKSPTNWARGLHQGLTRLDITSNPATLDGSGNWTREVKPAIDSQTDRVRPNPPTVRFRDPVMAEHPTRPASPRVFHQYTMSAPSMASSRDSKRRGWYQSGTHTHAEAPPEKMARVDRMVHPNIREFSGFPARSHPSGPVPRDETGGERTMGALETLVAVATGEGNTTKAY